jgi:dTDP-4-dehydrorhamnose reductase
MTEKILITGASGFIGGKLYQSLQSPSVYGTIFNSPINEHNLVRVNLADELETKKILNEIKPTVIFHFAGLTSPKKNNENPDIAFSSHVTSLKNILNNIDTENCHLIYLSTDKVFDGSASCPDELSPTSPSCLYGNLKLQCEELIKEKIQRYHIIRLSVVHSTGDLNSTSVIDSSLLQIKKKEKIKIFKNVLRCFADLNELVEVLQKLMHNSQYGVYHYGSDIVSYYDRMVYVCMRNKVEYKELIEGVNGEVFPLVQNFNTNKFKSLKF